METTTASKPRSNRSREWERLRRLKFNNAISKLGEIVKAINKANSTMPVETDDNAQYAKIEIVQKAIVCLNNCAQEKTQLKAEILALEVKLQAIEMQKLNRRDVSLQVAIGVNKRNPRSKYMKVVMMQKDKQINPKEKIIKPTPKVKMEKIITPTPKLPKLLPVSNIKKDNTFVMLPAAPYIFPQRSVLFPTVQPTIVLLDTNVQPISKSATVPIINRTANDITRTTMVNVLPISAYSRPLSASKSKRNNAKSRTGIAKKPTKKSKPNVKDSEDTDKCEMSSANAAIEDKQVAETEKTNTSKSVEVSEKIESIDKKENDKCLQNTKIEEKIISNDKNESKVSDKTKNLIPKCNTENQQDKCGKLCEKAIDPAKETQKELTSQTPTVPKVPDKPPDPPTNVINQNDKCTKVESEKLCDIRNKVKIQSILDPTICESVVETGNARLELAEEFLAASPTAAFLMSFPLVSGNRADSPAEEPQPNAVSNITKENNQQPENSNRTLQFFDKSQTPGSKEKVNAKSQTINNNSNKNPEQQKYPEMKQQTPSKLVATSTPNVCNENPFLNLPIPTVSSNCTLPDTTSFNLDFDCTLSKPIPPQTTASTSVSNSNIFYKSDTFTNVKNTIYSTCNITSSHEFNSLGLYPCAVDNYTNKTKTDYHNTEDNLMKINSSRLTYDIDLGWSHKGFDFVNNCTTASNTLHKDNILTTAPTPYSTSYNPFNPDFHVPLVPNSNKKTITTTKFTTFPETITSFYSQNSSLWPEEIPNIYSHSNVSKNFTTKQQNYVPVENMQPVINQKPNTTKQYEHKQISDQTPDNILKTPTLLGQQIPEKFTKKSPSKMHINWMTSEVRTMQNDCNQSQAEIKETFKLPYTQQNQLKKQAPEDTNYFPINMHSFPTQTNSEESHVWPTPRPVGTAEVTIEPPPINLPTLVGDLALGPHDRKKGDLANKGVPHADLQICNNFFSVTQLMNRSSDIVARHNGASVDPSKPPNLPKQNQIHAVSDNNRKPMPTRLENLSQVPYIFNENKSSNNFENMPQFAQPKTKPNKTDKNSKNQKNNYSAEALIRGGTCSQKHQDTKYLVGTQKYNDYNIPHDTGVAQVSHFPPIIDYADNNFASQQFSGTTLYNTTTNSISNTFYSNFMPSGGNLMPSNYAGGHFASEFVDYSNQTSDCNYTNQKYDAKLRNAPTYHQEKEPATYKSSRRETAAKHKLECSKKDASAKKYQSKRAKINEVEDWNDPSHVLWQNKSSVKRHPNIMPEESAFPNYVGNQMAAQYQPEYFNSHLVSNAQNMGPNGERALTSFPVASSRANFNLSALFPEITTKVQ